MERLANSGLAASASVEAGPAGHSRPRNSGEAAETDFAGIFAAIADGGAARQHLAVLHPWITVPVGAAMSVITTGESLPDESSLRDFAIAQGFDAAALHALFGTSEGARPTPLPGPVSTLPANAAFENGGLAGASAAGALVSGELARSGDAVQGVAPIDWMAAAGDLSGNPAPEASGGASSDAAPDFPGMAQPKVGVGEFSDFAKNPEVSRFKSEIPGQGFESQLEDGQNPLRAPHLLKSGLPEAVQTRMGAALQTPSALAVGYSGNAVIPASLHAQRAGWYAGSREGAVLTDPHAGTSGDWLAADGAAVTTGLSAKTGGESGSGASSANSGSNADVAAMDRLAAEVAEERLGLLIAQRMLSGIQRGEWRIRLLLRPESLGEVEIQMRMQGGALEAQLSAAQESTKDILNQGLERLREHFQRSGMEVASLGVSSHSKGGGDGKPTGQSAGRDAAPSEAGAEDRSSSDQNASAGGLSGSQWDMFV